MQSRDVDFSGSSATKPFKSGTGLPSSCGQGEMYYRMDATAGMNVYGCTATNSWTLEQGPPAASMASQLGDFAVTATSATTLAIGAGCSTVHTLHGAVRCAGVFVRQRRDGDHLGGERACDHLRFERGSVDGREQRDCQLQQRLRGAERRDRVSRRMRFLYLPGRRRMERGIPTAARTSGHS